LLLLVLFPLAIKVSSRAKWFAYFANREVEGPAVAVACSFACHSAAQSKAIARFFACHSAAQRRNLLLPLSLLSSCHPSPQAEDLLLPSPPPVLIWKTQKLILIPNTAKNPRISLPISQLSSITYNSSLQKQPRNRLSSPKTTQAQQNKRDPNGILVPSKPI
jgi:hypothetical protein